MRYIAWGARVSDTFLARARWIVDDLAIGEGSDDGLSKLLTCMAWETGYTFSPGVLNKAGSGATGLMQFMPATARALGTTTAKLAAMTAEDQLNYVWKYLADYKGKLKSLSDLYMAILWPKGVGKPETYVLWDRASKPTTYRQNAGFDTNKDSRITKAEASAKLNATFSRGMEDGNVLLLAGDDTDVCEVETAHSVAEVMEPEPVREVVYESRPVVQPLPGIVHPEDVAKPTVVEKVVEAAKGKTGTVTGAGLILGSLLANPDFTAKLAGFVMTLSRGEAPWGAIATVVGAGLIAYRGNRP